MTDDYKLAIIERRICIVALMYMIAKYTARNYLDLCRVEDFE